MSVQKLRDEARSAMEQGKFEIAVTKLRKAADASTMHPHVHVDIWKELEQAISAVGAQKFIIEGNALIKDGEWEMAEMKFSSAETVSDYKKVQKILKQTRANAVQKKLNHEKATRFVEQAKVKVKKEEYEKALTLLNDALKLAEVEILVKRLKKTKFETLSFYGFKKYEEGRTRERKREEDYEKTQEVHKKAINLFDEAINMNFYSKKERKAKQQATYRYDANNVFNKGVELEKKAIQLHQQEQFDESQKCYEEVITKFKASTVIYERGVAKDEEFQFAIGYTKDQAKSIAEVVECLNKEDLLRKLHKTDYIKRRDEAFMERDQEENNDNFDVFFEEL